ncbi:hypothetical protein A7982_13643 [Minicystis rosea]|nr:hypothetical protein A7982_13643 [Minicystis rosea]
MSTSEQEIRDQIERARQVSHIDIDENDLLSAEKLLLETAASHIPFVGGLISGLIGLLWPGADTTQDTWNRIKANVEALINEAIDKAIWDQAMAQVAAAHNVVNEFRNAADANVSPDNLRERYLAASAVFDALVPLFQHPSMEFRLLPLFCQAATLQLSLLSDGAAHGATRMGMNDTDHAYEVSRLNRWILTYRSYVVSTYTSEMAARSVNIQDWGTGRYYPMTVFSPYQAIRIQYRKACLDLALSWMQLYYVDPSKVYGTWNGTLLPIANLGIPISPQYVILTTASGTLETGWTLGEANIPFNELFVTYDVQKEMVITAQVTTKGDGARLKFLGLDNRVVSKNRPDAGDCDKNFWFGVDTNADGRSPPFGFSRVVYGDNPVTHVSMEVYADVISTMRFTLKDGSILGTANDFGGATLPDDKSTWNWGYGGNAVLVYFKGTWSSYYACIGCLVGATVPLGAYTAMLKGQCRKVDRETAMFSPPPEAFRPESLGARVIDDEGFAHASGGTTYHCTSTVELGRLRVAWGVWSFEPVLSFDSSASVKNGRDVDFGARRFAIDHLASNQVLTAEMLGGGALAEYPFPFNLDSRGCASDAWIIEPHASGTYRIISKQTHRALTLVTGPADASGAPGAGCILSPIDEVDPHQAWRLEEVTDKKASKLVSHDGKWVLALDAREKKVTVHPNDSLTPPDQIWRCTPRDSFHEEWPVEVLRTLSDGFIERLPEPARAVVRQRLGR